MIFITEDEVRARCPQPGGALTLAPGERLTPSASEYMAGMHITVTRAECAPGAQSPEAGCAGGRVHADCGMTWLDHGALVPKTNARIIFRGKLDSLLASIVLAQTQFDPKDRLPALLKDALADVKNWVMHILAAELAGGIPESSGMAGLDEETLHAVSRDPKKYLDVDHCMADASQGGNLALVNWLRALVRESELEALRHLPDNQALCASLNRLSSALYVLMLLTISAQKGKDIPRLCGQSGQK